MKAGSSLVAGAVLALSLTACVYDFAGFGPGEGGGTSSASSSSGGGLGASSSGGGTTSSSASSTASSGGGTGGDGASSTGSSGGGGGLTTGASSGGGGMGGAGGAGGMGGEGSGGGAPEPLGPCTATDDFAPFDPEGSVWDYDYEVTAQNQSGDGYATVRANATDGYAGLWRQDLFSPAACFASIRVEAEGGNDLNFYAFCENDAEVGIYFDPSTRLVSTYYVDGDVQPDSADLSLSGMTLEGFRLSFAANALVSEVRASGTWLLVDKVALPSWAVNCTMGIDMYGATSTAARVDDWCVDPPDPSVTDSP